MRPTGNVKSGVTKKHLLESNDQPRTTIKEQTENTIHTKHGVGQLTLDIQLIHQPVYGQDTTCPALGNPSAMKALV